MTRLPWLPHTYPFRFVDTVVRERGEEGWTGTVRVRVSAAGRASMGEAWSPTLLAEAVAQAAVLLEGGDPDLGRRGFLAGIDQFQVSRTPQPGETLEIEVRLAARFGAIVKFSGVIRSSGETIGEGSVLVRQGASATHN